MAASLSAYWVKFFQGAGFPLDVATRHAVVFSNNRIKPDMLPDLDKASLKDMGITLIGDMIAILRYAKKVVEAMTCENFLVDTEDEKPVKKVKTAVAGREAVKNVAVKVAGKSLSAGKGKSAQEAPGRAATRPPVANSVSKASAVKKKVLASPRLVSAAKEVAKPPTVKRKIVPKDSESESDEMGELDVEREEWARKNGKKLKLGAGEDEKVGYTVIMPKGRTVRGQQILKKVTDQKRTVFDRLGDSSVTSTTNPAESNAAPTFNITGLGNESLKRTFSVFNRLGDKDAMEKVKKTTICTKDSSDSSRPGILKTARPSSVGSTTISLKKEPSLSLTSKTIGTMHADHEKNQKTTASVRQLVRTTKKIRLNQQQASPTKFPAKVVTKISKPASKLASERVGIVPAKARLGVGGNTATKQVTFDRFAQVTSFEKPGVFSRLGF